MDEAHIKHTKSDALALLKKNRLEDAKLLYESVCRESEDDEAWFHLGAINGKLGLNADAVTCFRHAIKLQPYNPMSHYNYALALARLDKTTEAIANLRKALDLKPDFIQAYHSLGELLAKLGNIDAAINCFMTALNIRPSSPGVLNRLGELYTIRKEYHHALNCFTKALEYQPGYIAALGNAGAVLRIQGKYKESIKMLRLAENKQPENADTNWNIGLALMELHQYSEAEKYFHIVLHYRPESESILNNLGKALLHQWQLTEAENFLRKAIVINPDIAEIHTNLGLVLQYTGKIDESIDCFRNALRLKPDYDQAHSSMLFSMNYTNTFESNTVFMEHTKWARKYKNIHNKPLTNNPDPSRGILRIGYVSPDFCSHPVSVFMEPLLKQHDTKAFDITCYAEEIRPDAVTKYIKTLVGHWRTTNSVSDKQLADQIRADGIDILVDLAGHSANNRLRVFAYKPAPIQVTYLGYPNTTGIASIDYRITDAQADPPGISDKLHSETLIRLPHGFLCYQPPPDTLTISPLPSKVSGYTTFGSFNTLCKVTPEVIKQWSRILQSVPNSRLLLKNNQLSDKGTQNRYSELFQAHGIPPDRLILRGRVPSLVDHLSVYGQIDIALDTFPYNGTTTTCEALWMGVPVIVLAGHQHAGRVGVSIMSSLGLESLIAADMKEYIALAISMADNLGSLEELRSSLRDKMSSSRLCDSTTFTKTLEESYHFMWETWCDNRARSY